MKILSAGFLLTIALAGCSQPDVDSNANAHNNSPASSTTARKSTLLEARRSFKTKLTPQNDPRTPADVPPSAIFRAVKYTAPSGQLAAYMSPAPKDSKKHPAIIWITGGDSNSLGDVWSPASRDNDQTAAAYRKAGIVMMFPSLRGGNDNPGKKEGFLGEVDDILAAVKHLEQQSYVDPKRIYLGGHSTGGTLALLVAEYSNRFRGVFAFGPADDVSGYGESSGFLPFNTKNEEEIKLRSPIHWLDSIESPTWVLEGTIDGNLESLLAMKRVSTNPQVHFLEVKGADHFSVLAPTNELIAKRILSDTGAATNIALTQEEVSQNFAQ